MTQADEFLIRCRSRSDERPGNAEEAGDAQSVGEKNGPDEKRKQW